MPFLHLFTFLMFLFSNILISMANQRVINKETGCLIHLAFTTTVIHETMVTTLLLKQLICFTVVPQTSCDSAWPYCNDYPAQFRRGGKNLGNLGIVDIDVDPACTSGFLNTIHILSTFVYEAISKFDRKLDVFSFGHLALRKIEFGYKWERLQSGTTKWILVWTVWNPLIRQQTNFWCTVAKLYIRNS